MWEYTGKRRPPFAATPGSGQESVWDYPRPPALEPSTRRVRVLHGDTVIAETARALRIAETASPPTYDLPEDDVDLGRLVGVPGRSFCEWKGAARYYGLAGGDGTAVAWRYDAPPAAYAALRGHLAFYPGRVACFLDAERVRPQPGGFYGGWITDDLVGPFKGTPDTGHW